MLHNSLIHVNYDSLKTFLASSMKTKLRGLFTHCPRAADFQICLNKMVHIYRSTTIIIKIQLTWKCLMVFQDKIIIVYWYSIYWIRDQTKQ